MVSIVKTDVLKFVVRVYYFIIREFQLRMSRKWVMSIVFSSSFVTFEPTSMNNFYGRKSWWK